MLKNKTKKPKQTRNHNIIVPSNIKITLIKLSIPPLSHSRLITTIHSPNVVSLNALDRVGGDIASEGDSEIVTQGTQFTWFFFGGRGG